ncbi:MAG: hypothetical protein O2854_09925, partial [Chloroflexi bacterium]|nr:hypothetical protein [Chloroflexota bacterium]
MVNEVLPEDLQDRDRVLDKKGISNLLREVAQKHPEKYREISHRLNQIGWRASQESGGYSFGLRHMQKSKYAIESRKDLQNNLDKILGDEGIDDKTREAKIIKLVSAIQQAQQDPIYDEAMAADNPLAYQVLSGSRGNKMNLASLLGSDLLYSNHRDQVIPVPVLRSYSEGLTPAEYWAGTYGARKGVMATKFATQEAGFLCLGLGTLVRMADYTVKRIENVQVGDTVLGASKDGMTFPVRVSACFDNGVREVSRYRFRVGKSRNGFEEIVATEDHNILAKMKRGRPGTPHGDKNSILEPTKLPLRGAG